VVVIEACPATFCRLTRGGAEASEPTQEGVAQIVEAQPAAVRERDALRADLRPAQRARKIAGLEWPTYVPVKLCG
jgi:hypothetical protein